MKEKGKNKCIIYANMPYSSMKIDFLLWEHTLMACNETLTVEARNSGYKHMNT